MTVAFHTLGCKLNQYETESLAEAFRSEGFAVHSREWLAPLYIVNSCTVTSKAEQKARRVIRGLARGDAAVIVTGCYAQVEGPAVSRIADDVIVISQRDKAIIHGLPSFLKEIPHFEEASGSRKKQHIERFLESHRDTFGGPFEYRVADFSFHSRAFLKIQDGCDNACAYCRVPQARGASVSLDPEEVITRFRRLADRGHREVVVTGVNVTDYRFDGCDLAGLIKRLTAEGARIRIRVSSLEPERIDEELADALAHEAVCPHFHVPIQTGSDAILAAMRRRYNAERVVRGVSLLRSVKPEAFIAGDFLVGFPGESDDDFDQSKRLIQRLDLARLHVFPFSPRPGTAAFGLEPKVPAERKKRRVRVLLEISDRRMADYSRGWRGRTVEAVLEGRRTDGGLGRGVSENYLKLEISHIPPEDYRPHALAACRIEETDPCCRARFLGYRG